MQEAELVAIEQIYDTVLEAEVLGTILASDNAPQRQAEALDMLTDGCFYDARHKALYALMADLRKVKAPVCVESIEHQLTLEPGLVARMGDSVWLTLLMSTASGTLLNTPGHIRRLLWMAKERRDREIGLKLARGANGSLPRLIEELSRPAYEEPEKGSSAEEVMGEVVEAYQAAAELAAKGRKFAGLDTGFDELNDALNGLCPGEFTVIGARPSIGKTTLSLQMAMSVAEIDCRPVGVISLEMTRAQMGMRLACIKAGVDPTRQRKGMLTPKEVEALFHATSEIAPLPLRFFVMDRTIEGICQRIRKESNVDLWIVDHLHRITGGKGDSDHERLGGYAQSLADLAVTTNKHIILVSQLNRGSESKSDHRPQMSDLRGSGSIEEHAVNVLLIHRPGHYNDVRANFKNSPQELEELVGTVEILCEKLRFGLVGTKELVWDQSAACYRNRAPVYRQPAENPWWEDKE